MALSSQGLKGRRPPPPLSHKQKKFNTFLPSFSSPTQENILVFMLLMCQSVVCVILFSNAIAPYIVTLHNSIGQKTQVNT